MRILDNILRFNGIFEGIGQFLSFKRFLRMLEDVSGNEGTFEDICEY